jgi:hypothetical protein
MADERLDSYATHLEFLGYGIEHREKSIAANHPRKPNIQLQYIFGGVLHSTFWGMKSEDQLPRRDLLEYVNDLNANAAICRFYVDKDGDLMIEAWHPERYERTEYGRFLDLWNSDMQDFIADARTKEYLR